MLGGRLQNPVVYWKDGSPLFLRREDDTWISDEVIISSNYGVRDDYAESSASKIYLTRNVERYLF